jgi:hypothetical protein
MCRIFIFHKTPRNPSFRKFAARTKMGQVFCDTAHQTASQFPKKRHKKHNKIAADTMLRRLATRPRICAFVPKARLPQKNGSPKDRPAFGRKRA